MLGLVPNDPLDLPALESLLSDRDELFLVWPDARFPLTERSGAKRCSRVPATNHTS
jgi:hypothetical protein